MDQDATWYGGRLGRGHIVLDGNPAPPHQKRGHSPQFSTHVCCGQTAGWIKMPLGTDVDIDPGYIVTDGDPAPQKGSQHPHFSVHVYCGETAEWIKMSLGTEVGLGLGDVVLDGDPASPTERGTAAPPTFRPTLLWHGRPSQRLLSTCTK